ncbi:MULTISPECIES: lysine--tRNA ligase [Methylobacterium]|jgi:lysyl-tRNA synthetase class 1|uniref:lysine--tRNA ligase n=1 Tax=Methylobacterium TaxID=407 RepID=UPI0008E4BE4E|nr:MULTISPECIES: lysine--tRNA ligase [Methylobacterium]MBZ6412001.1 lysine--tRNA ligase [Methylobacterium sp.]MBK3398138.1 lysine--tRNA ligase [Methylobacterium ajmalii]MBK3406781.1 lysine--tRNA ligase [Methylobacterium ajmalii]MBK3426133.1 lysine--tRNA ligase [Methylobacterium ajmalii]SFF15162.1 lysyl-tRNA synthetase, class I [Methylobacterium sp. yr596]
MPAPFRIDPALAEAAASASAWPFEEARKLVARLERTGKGEVLFETGYGPSGLPHIGTFGEVARTSMVRHAFRTLTNDSVPTRLVAFSDDMDGLRKVPENVPNKALLAENLNKPLTAVPDPFGTHDSFGAHNNAELRRFLDKFGFEYEFLSATECYRAGRFDATLLRVLERYDAVMAVMLPSLRAERSASYSPFLPLHPVTGHVMQVPIDEVKVSSGTIVWRDPATGEAYETPVTGGHAKLQWKPDWAMRWVALGVDYEMAGKDLIDSVKLSGQIARVLGAEPPEGFNYELFLDEKGQKISKSKGNGLTIDEWLAYGTPESLALFMYNKPREAKRLHFDVIPRHVDDYLSFLEKFPGQEPKLKLGNPTWHLHAGTPPEPERVGEGGALPFAMLLNLVAVANTEDPAVLWGFIRRYAPEASPETHPRLDRLVHHAVRYFRDFVRPQKTYRTPSAEEAAALADLSETLAAQVGSTDPEALQAAVYEVGRRHFPDLSGKSKSPDGRPGVSQTWFTTLYGILLGEARGPRFGSFVALYGVEETRALIARALSGALAEEHAAFLESRDTPQAA